MSWEKWGTGTTSGRAQAPLRGGHRHHFGAGTAPVETLQTARLAGGLRCTPFNLLINNT